MRIVFSTFGTFGDINPLIALSLELKRRGHTPVIAAPGMFREKIEPLGIDFAAVRPDQDPNDKRMVEMIWDIKKGTERGLREFLFPAIRDSYKDLLATVEAHGGADLLVTGELAYAGPIVAEKTGIPWASYVLAPLSFFSGYDPPVLPPYPTLSKVQSLVPGVGHLVPRFARLVTRHWPAPIYALRKDLGLPRGKDPIFDAKHSELLVLALFSRVLGDPQPDWPASTRITGFAFYDGDAGNVGLAPDLEEFLASGPPPLVFTLGSAAVMAAGDFYEVSAATADLLGQRAVLLTGSDPQNRPKRALSKNICIARYAPYSRIFPRASVIIHQGGVGTTAQGLKAGRPMLVMPYSHDQPDNARRVRHLGVAKVIQRKEYRPEAAAQKIQKLLEDAAYTERAAEVARVIAEEDGVRTACDALERAARTKL
ncbi:UDP:flavonoid glycosyltransferase YjiC (YdhE family) [Silvibacterium bohemicum]|uniref:UDP:flavonoid glycosyltransferase YjiC (YdhE family) n=1 Tax=Silvibacterium bohemicum TaxID=1577686 RepID=A0A841K4K2_9BACT|nr:glycosyltransferase [Silvibacterium bohemicum]MBB6146869.1 UDP:flavonoid glycosyltransferase YjiC (YdhE family) [Silvibacterium bohemicum]